MDHQAGGFEVRRHVGERELQRLKVGELAAELLALEQVIAGNLQARLRGAQRAGADVDAPAVEARHGDLEALPFRADEVLRRHAAVLEDDHRGRLAVPAELLLLGAEGEARRIPLNRDA